MDKAGYKYYCHLNPSYDCILSTNEITEVQALRLEHGDLLVVEEHGKKVQK